jgi:hypothetical protein
MYTKVIFYQTSLGLGFFFDEVIFVEVRDSLFAFFNPVLDNPFWLY